jgi:hypothetical protein
MTRQENFVAEFRIRAQNGGPENFSVTGADSVARTFCFSGGNNAICRQEVYTSGSRVMSGDFDSVLR